MQFIRQDYRVDTKNMNKLLDKYGKVHVRLNSQAIKDDIEKMKKLAEASNKKLYVKNCWRIVDYLDRLGKVAKNEEEIRLDFKYNGDFIESSPIDIRKINGFNVQTTDYFDVMGKSVLTLDYSKLMDAMALDIGYLDLGYTTEEIEDKLKDVGIVATYDSSDFGDLLEDNLYIVMCGLKIEDSPYVSVDNKNMHDYFGDKVKDRVNYLETLTKSSKKIMAIVAMDVLTEADKHSCKIELAGVYEDSLVILVPDKCSVELLSEKLAQPQVIRLFGRKFLFKPEVQIY